MTNQEQKEHLVAVLESLGGRASKKNLRASLRWDKRTNVSVKDALTQEKMLSCNGGAEEAVTLVGYEQTSPVPQQEESPRPNEDVSANNLMPRRSKTW